MANLITSLRILFSLILLFCQVLSPEFYLFYSLAGFTDMIDGTIARKTKTVSEFGSRLDTIADFIFMVVALVKIVPVVRIELWLYIWIGIIALIKIINIISGFVVEKRLVAVHSIMNKVTGLFLFVLPLTLSFIEFKFSAIFVCALGTLAAIQEGHIISSTREKKAMTKKDNTSCSIFK